MLWQQSASVVQGIGLQFCALTDIDVVKATTTARKVKRISVRGNMSSEVNLE